MLAQLISPVTGLLDKFIEDKDQKAALAHEISTMAERHTQELAMSQIAVNQEEAKSGSLFIGGWRPFVGWTCGIALMYHFILQPCILFFATIFGAELPPLPSFDICLLYTSPSPRD